MRTYNKHGSAFIGCKGKTVFLTTVLKGFRFLLFPESFYFRMHLP